MERLMEIVNFVMKQVLYQGDNTCSERDLIDALTQLGYAPIEIDMAFKFLYSLPNSIKPEQKDLLADIKEGYRILSAAEQKKLSIACQGEIIRLMYSSLLTLSELEKVLEEALKIESVEVGLKELEFILHKVINDEERLLMILPYAGDAGPSFLLN